MMFSNKFHALDLLPLLLIAANAAVLVPRAGPEQPASVSVDLMNAKAPQSKPVPEAFVSYSIELAHFPQFAGNLSKPNNFSNTLLDNLQLLSNSTPPAKPYIRVGGNTQDYASYNATLETAWSISQKTQTGKSASKDISLLSKGTSALVQFGPKFFESYKTWPDVKFTHGLNLAKSAASMAERNAMLASLEPACEALGDGKLLSWELGNEPNLYTPGVRNSAYNEQDYVYEWLNTSQAIAKALNTTKNCANLSEKSNFKFMAPSLSNVGGNLDMVKIYQDGLGRDDDIASVSVHNYMGNGSSPASTLSSTLLNHNRTLKAVAAHSSLAARLHALPSTSNVPPQYILGEANSLYGGGKANVSNTFGAALWNLDFLLACAANNISRVHLHTGIDLPYSAWQPVDTAKEKMGVKPPYYGHLAAAAALSGASVKDASVGGDHTPGIGEGLQSAAVREHGVTPSGPFGLTVAEIPLPNNTAEAGYAIYTGSALARLVLINLREFDSSARGGARGNTTYDVTVPSSCAGNGGKGVGTGASCATCLPPKQGVLKRLTAQGSEVTEGVTFNGMNYDVGVQGAAAPGLGVKLRDAKSDEGVPGTVAGGGLSMSVEVADSEAVIVDLPFCQQNWGP